ncbi:MAG: hypothetical protein JWL77_6531 [Chthonomonadaceae bacterium]|nr:hypothetical protein [Chthonomonadaceae bacterium]
MAPPVSQNPGYAGAQQPPMGGNMAPPVAMNNGQGTGVYQWQDVPVNQQVPILRATFDQGGYQIFAQNGETIVVPFANNNMYVMKFGRSNGDNYFVNENGVPVLYLRPGQGLENAAAQGALWYPIPQNYAYSAPMYVALAPTWGEYANMGWYPGMTYYGGMWGYSPYSHFAWMPGFYISVGGRRYTDYGGYHSYYTSTPGYIRNRVVYNNYNVPRGVSGRSFGSSTGSFGSGRTGSTGSFGSGRTNNSSSTFGSRPSSSTGSFGSGRSGGGFGGGSTRTFGGGATSGSGGSFGSRPSGSSFGGGSSGYSAPSRPSGSSFGGGGRSSGGSSFGGGGRSSGGGSFGGSRRR